MIHDIVVKSSILIYRRRVTNAWIRKRRVTVVFMGG